MFHGLRSIRRRKRGERGQTATEYMMVISVIVIASAAATYYVFDSEGSGGPIKQGLNDLLNSSGTSSKNIPAQVKRGFIDQSP